MSEIRVLDRAVSELIAAGEVVTRPASAVKELVENSIDAGATAVTVEIQRGGVRLIRVTDNGCGIPRQQIPTAFLRHATSKLRAAADLETIGTLGFRGEALPSIAAVSRVRLVSKTADSELGAEYRIEGGEELSLTDAGCADGTSITVSDLFYNTPARMKFLKKDVSEGNAVQEVMQQLALAYPTVSMRMVRDGRQTLFTGGNGLEGALFAVFPRTVFTELLSVEHEQNGYFISGFVSAPHAARASRSLQYTFVNGRFVKNKTVTAAAEEAYRTFSHKGSFPAFALFVNTVPERVDVNVHPAKTEIRFTNEREVFSAVYAAVRGAVAADAAAPVLTAGETAAPPAAQEPAAAAAPGRAGVPQDGFSGDAGRPAAVRTGGTPLSGGEAPFSLELFAGQPIGYDAGDGGGPALHQPGRSDYRPSIDIWRDESDDMLGRSAGQAAAVDRSFAAEAALAEQAPEAVRPAKQPRQTALDGFDAAGVAFVGEAFKTYIIMESGDQLIFMDKHAAHERALFERFSAQLSAERQLLLEPIVVGLDAEHKQALLDHTEEVAQAGLVVDDFGPGQVAVREIPLCFSRSAAEMAAGELADQLVRGGSGRSDDLLRLLQSVSCRAAIKAGDRSTPEELRALALRVLSGEVPRFCPHGRPLYFIITKKELDKRFDRT